MIAEEQIAIWIAEYMNRRASWHPGYALENTAQFLSSGGALECAKHIVEQLRK